MKKLAWGVLVGLLATVTACGNDASVQAGSTVTVTGGGQNDAWSMLLSGDWEIEGGEEGYVCVYATASEDIYVNAFRPLAPLGTHHTVLSVASSPRNADGSHPCEASTNGQAMLYGSGIDTEAFALPEGVAVKVPQGSQLVLNLHLLNASTSSLLGTSGVEAKTLSPEQVEHEAEVLLAGKTSGLLVDMGESTQTGHCTLDTDGTLGAAFPHMHNLGVHMRARIEGSSPNDALIIDEPYSFDNQQWYDTAGLGVTKGDVVRVECSYVNNTTDVVHYGDSSYA